MKLILVNQRYGHTRTIVIRGWMKGLLSLCLLGAPVALGYLGYELALADSGSNALISQETQATADELAGHAHDQLQQDQLQNDRSQNDRSHNSASYQSAFADDTVDTVVVLRGAEQALPVLAAAASTMRPPLAPASGLSLHLHPQSRSVFAHGRVIDPAVYSRHSHC